MADSQLSCLEFRFQGRTLRGQGCSIRLPHNVYPNIVRLRLDEESSQFLPQKIILKKKDENTEPLIFHSEQNFYENSKELQGRGLVPQNYGLASIGDSPALVLSDLGGTMLHDQPSLSLDEENLRRNLRELLEAIRRAGVVHDISLLNVLFCADGRLRLIDFEMAKIGQPVDETKLENEIGIEVDDLVRYLKGHQMAKEERGVT